MFPEVRELPVTEVFPPPSPKATASKKESENQHPPWKWYEYLRIKYKGFVTFSFKIKFYCNI
jgi:hypothetical protein